MIAYGCFIAPRLQPGVFALFVPPFLWLAIVSRYPFRYGLVGLWPLIGAPLAFYRLAVFAFAGLSKA
jgi:hypothetical protein